MSTKPSVTQLRRLIGNPDAYAVQHEDGTWHPERDTLTDYVLEQHLGEYLTVGTYIGHVIDDETVARTLVFDMDTEDAVDEAPRIRDALVELGVSGSAIGTENSGRKGFHVWAVLQEFTPNVNLRRLGRAACALASVKCEVFPKQDEVRDLGNLVKLPGGIHQVSKQPAYFVDTFPLPLPRKVFEGVLSGLPEEVKARRQTEDTRFPCLEAIQDEGADEGSRNIQLFHLATLFRRNGATDETVELIVRHVNAKSTPPLDSLEIDALLDSSRHSGPLCDQIPEERHCGELCIRTRTSGLYTRPGQLRGAAVGENVVVTVKANSGTIIELGHDDLRSAKGALRAS